MNKELIIFLVLLFIFCIISSYSVSNFLKREITTVEPYDNVLPTILSQQASNTNYDNYNHYTGSSNPTIYYAPDGSTAKIMYLKGTFTIITTSPSGQTTNYNYIYVATNSENINNINDIHTLNDLIVGKPFISSSNSNDTAVFVKNNTNDYEIIVKVNGNTIPYYATPMQPQPVTSTNPPYIQSNNNWDNSNNNSLYATSSTNANDYYSTLPIGIPASNIPQNSQDQYILKSQIVPIGPLNQVCPTCGKKEEKCPPCPACARCPEPAITCKAVPNYDSQLNNTYDTQMFLDNPSMNAGTMPSSVMPTLNSFSSFGL